MVLPQHRGRDGAHPYSAPATAAQPFSVAGHAVRGAGTNAAGVLPRGLSSLLTIE
ncbi:hypothetical protein [Nocardia pseudovaccinii]|uniref:hypothetical protein n=1 Tax=Nocardia pseudovaccinii TaxID=189540 RepID=UPI000B259E7F|nr:hypothetical protein [Nocardia pseudovaccinii]